MRSLFAVALVATTMACGPMARAADETELDPAMARQWYQRAAELGSADARRRLSQLQN